VLGRTRLRAASTHSYVPEDAPQCYAAPKTAGIARVGNLRRSLTYVRVGPGRGAPRPPGSNGHPDWRRPHSRGRRRLSSGARRELNPVPLPQPSRPVGRRCCRAGSLQSRGRAVHRAPRLLHLSRGAAGRPEPSWQRRDSRDVAGALGPRGPAYRVAGATARAGLTPGDDVGLTRAQRGRAVP